MKKKFLALTMASAVMLMGAGYAYWTEEFKITNTVNLGALDYQFTFDDNPDNRIVEGHQTGGSVTYGASDNILNVSLTNMYPGAEATVKFGMKNNGSIDEQLKDFDFKIKSGDATEAKFILLTSAKIDNVEQLPTTTGTIYELARLGATGKIPILKTDDELAVELRFKVDQNADYDNLEDNADISFDIIADVLQHNDDVH